MLRPATPLTILLLASFILLLLSVLSTPIIKSVPIATRQGVNFGVFGFCTPERCSGPRVGYNTDERFGNDSTEADFSVPSSTRTSLSALLIVHPIAALFNLVCLALAGAAHFHSPSHSARYLLALLILLLPTLLVTLLAFLVDILVFVPHLQWGGWIVLASTILITASGVVTCAMRRTLVSRKARKKRIAENAEMSGENFYNRQSSIPKIDSVSAGSSGDPKSPVVNAGPSSDTLPAFTTFTKEHDVFARKSDLGRNTSSSRMDNRSAGYGGTNGEALDRVQSRSQERYRGSREDYRGPLPPPNLSGAAAPNLRRHPSDPNLERTSSQERLNGLPTGQRDGFNAGGQRGRGGYPPRGGYGHGPPRGGFAASRGNSPHAYGRGGHSDGRANYSSGRGRGGVMAGGTIMVRPQQGPPPGYPPQGGSVAPERYGSQDQLRGVPPQAFGGAAGAPRRASLGAMGRRPSPGLNPALPQGGLFVGQAVEMDAATGRVSQAADRPQGGDGVYDLVTLPPNEASGSGAYSLTGAPGPANIVPPTDLASPSSVYSHAPDAYLPTRAAWTHSGYPSSPSRGRPVASAAGISSQSSSNAGSGQARTRPRAPSSHYYEDVDPRFSDVNADPSPAPEHPPAIPASLMPGGPSSAGRQLPRSHDLGHTPSDENLQDGARSPTGSEASHFTSVSQRGINPRWKPGGGDMRSMPPPSTSTMRKPVVGPGGARERDVLVQNNPDFEIPGTRPPGRGVPRGVPGGVAMSGQPELGGRLPMPSNGNGLTGMGRYPQP